MCHIGLRIGNCILKKKSKKKIKVKINAETVSFEIYKLICWALWIESVEIFRRGM